MRGRASFLYIKVRRAVSIAFVVEALSENVGAQTASCKSTTLRRGRASASNKRPCATTPRCYWCLSEVCRPTLLTCRLIKRSARARHAARNHRRPAAVVAHGRVQRAADRAAAQRPGVAARDSQRQGPVHLCHSRDGLLADRHRRLGADLGHRLVSSAHAGRSITVLMMMLLLI